MEQLQAALAAHLGPGCPPGVLALLQATAGTVQPLDVHICSAGGTASTALSNFLNAYGFKTNMLLDTDGLRHCPVPPSWSLASDPNTPHPGKPRTVLYLYANPVDVVASHYRRGHAYHQATKTCGNPAVAGPEHTFPTSLQEYLERGEDCFGLQAHFHAWSQGARAYDVILCKYENMWQPEVALQLFQHLCSHKLPADAIQAMAQNWVGTKAPRASQVHVPEGASHMYTRLQLDMQRLPPLMLVPARRQAPSQVATHSSEVQQLVDQMALLLAQGGAS